MLKFINYFALFLTLSLITAKWFGLQAIGTLALTWPVVFLPLGISIGLVLLSLLVSAVIMLLGFIFLARR